MRVPHPLVRIRPQLRQGPVRPSRQRLHKPPHLRRDRVLLRISINSDPARAVPHLDPDTLKDVLDALLELLPLVPLRAETAARGLRLGRDGEEEREVRRGERDVWGAAPFVGHPWEVLRRGEGDPGEGVAVAEDGRAGGEGLLNGFSVARWREARESGGTDGEGLGENGTYESSQRFAEKRRWTARSSISDCERR